MIDFDGEWTVRTWRRENYLRKISRLMVDQVTSLIRVTVGLWIFSKISRLSPPSTFTSRRWLDLVTLDKCEPDETKNVVWSHKQHLPYLPHKETRTPFKLVVRWSVYRDTRSSLNDSNFFLIDRRFNTKIFYYVVQQSQNKKDYKMFKYVEDSYVYESGLYSYLIPLFR